MGSDYDVIVLAGGSPGEHCAGALAEGGAGLREAAAGAQVDVEAALAWRDFMVSDCSDGERLGPDAGEWLQQATLAIGACVPLDVLRDTIQPLPTFSEFYLAALKTLRSDIDSALQPAGEAQR